MAEETFSEYSYGLLQSLYYNAEIGSLLFRPFVEIGAGNSHAKVSLESRFFEDKSDSKSLLYFKYNLGAQFLSKNGVGAELKGGQQRNNDYKANVGSLSFVYTF